MLIDTSNYYLGKAKKRSPKETMLPKTLYKRSSLIWDNTTKTVLLRPLAQFQKAYVTMNAEAKCQREGVVEGASHYRGCPSRFCVCGFYAYSDRQDAVDHIQADKSMYELGAGSAILKVIASGKMFEYKKGYRFGHQRVEQVEVPKCAFYSCTNAPDRFLLDDPERGFKYSYRGCKDQTSMVPVCSSHALGNSEHQMISFTEFEEFASASLPSHAPRVEVVSSAPHWESDVIPERIGKPFSWMSPKALAEADNEVKDHSLARGVLGLGAALVTLFGIVSLLANLPL